MQMSDMIILVSAPLIFLFTLFSLKKVGAESLRGSVNPKDGKLLSLVVLYLTVITFYKVSCLSEYTPSGLLEGNIFSVFANNVYIVAIYTLIFVIAPSCLILWVIIKKIYNRKNMSTAITFVHVISMLTVERIMNYNYMNYDDGIFFWLICYAILLYFGMLEGGKTKKKMAMLLIVVLGLIALLIFGEINVINLMFVWLILSVETIALYMIQNKLCILRNVIRQSILLLLVIIFVFLNSNI